MGGVVNPNLVVLAWVAILLYIFIILFFVIRGALKTKNISDYAVGSMNFSPVAVGLALAASITSAATFIINPGFVALYGLSAFLSFGVFLPLSALISLAILSKGFRKYGAQIKALTLAEWIGKKYNSPGLTLFFGFLSLLLITFIVLISVGLTKIISKSLNVAEINVLIGIVVFVFGYMMFGGANSMVYTNTIQAILMIIVAFILLGSGYEHFSKGVYGFINSLNAIDPKLTQLTNGSSFLFRDLFELIVVPIIIGVAIICQPHILTKSLLLKTNKDVNKYLLVGIVTEALFFLVIFAGFYARLTFPDLSYNGAPLKMDGILSAYVVQKFSVYIAILVVMGLISAGLSTLEGLIQALASTITLDIIQPLFKNHLPSEQKKKEKAGIIINRITILSLAVISVYLSYGQLVHPKLSVGIFAQNGVYAYFAAAFVPILFGIYFKNINKIIPIIASVTAIVVHFTMYYGKLPIPFSKATGENPGVAAATAIILSLLLGLLLKFIYERKNYDYAE
ncbi:MAG TPA: sodium:solute symporter [Ignavibacteria bacterium]|nr:sodium:solute symporter [Ignavibacteria bacterium]